MQIVDLMAWDEPIFPRAGGLAVRYVWLAAPIAPAARKLGLPTRSGGVRVRRGVRGDVAPSLSAALVSLILAVVPLAS